MDQLITESLRDFNVVSMISLWEMVAVLCVSAVLNLIVAKVYVATHGNHSYSRSYIHTMIFVGITISLIMVIIGSNIARAFALVGAMSIIRFRNPVKDPRDVAFLFIAMAIGMAAGTKFYLFATIFTAFICFVAMALQAFRIGEHDPVSFVVRMRMSAALRGTVEEAIKDATSSYHVVSIDRLAERSGADDFIYELTLRKGETLDRLLSRITAVSEEISLNVLVGEGNVNV